MNKLQIIGIIFMSYLLAACTTAEPAPRTTATATPTRESVEEPAGGTAVEPTAEPTTAIQEDLTPIPEETAVEYNPEVRREILSQTLPAYLMSGNFQALEALMGDSFVIGYWRSEGQTLTPAEAVEQLRLNLLPDPMAFRFTNDRSLFPNLGDVDPTKAFGPQIKVVDLVYSEGWGADGQGEAILAIGLNVEGQYWSGMIYAPAGFEEGTETNGGSQQGLNTYVNEHAGYAFDYPADWTLTGEPHPNSYNYVISIQSFMLGGGTGSVPADQAKLDFVTCNSAECNTLQAVQAQIDEQVAAGTLEILSEENWTLAGGIPAFRRQVVGEMGMEVASLITEFDGRALRVSGYGDLAAFDEIVRTLRPATTVPSETGLRAIIEIPQSLPKGEPVKLQFFLINDSDGKLYVLNWFTPLEGLGGEIFLVKRDGDMAEDTLMRYFSLLNQGKYGEAAALYGGEYETLINYNPTSDPADHAHLLEMGCTVNGLQCLPARSIQPTAECSNSFEFSVQFENPDGSLFIQNPEGDWPESTLPRSTFQYTVMKIEDGFLVQELPVYVP